MKRGDGDGCWVRTGGGVESVPRGLKEVESFEKGRSPGHVYDRAPALRPWVWDCVDGVRVGVQGEVYSGEVPVRQIFLE